MTAGLLIGGVYYNMLLSAFIFWKIRYDHYWLAQWAVVTTTVNLVVGPLWAVFIKSKGEFDYFLNFWSAYVWLNPILWGLFDIMVYDIWTENWHLERSESWNKLRAQMFVSGSMLSQLTYFYTTTYVRDSYRVYWQEHQDPQDAAVTTPTQPATEVLL